MYVANKEGPALFVLSVDWVTVYLLILIFASPILLAVKNLQPTYFTICPGLFLPALGDNKIKGDSQPRQAGRYN